MSGASKSNELSGVEPRSINLGLGLFSLRQIKIQLYMSLAFKKPHNSSEIFFISDSSMFVTAAISEIVKEDEERRFLAIWNC